MVQRSLHAWEQMCVLLLREMPMDGRLADRMAVQNAVM